MKPGYSTTLKNMESGALLITQVVIFGEKSSNDTDVKNDSDESNSMVQRFRNILICFVHKV